MKHVHCSFIIFIFLGFLNAHAAITKQEYDEVTEQVARIYNEIATESLDETPLLLVFNWETEVFTAKAQCKNPFKDNHILIVSGNVARKSLMTKEAFAGIACHELGHCLGGAPNFPGQSAFQGVNSVEGQADYWSSTTCLRRYFELESNNNLEWLKSQTVDPAAWKKCSEVYQDIQSQVVCVKTAMTGIALARIMESDQREFVTAASLSTPSTVQVSKIERYHPPVQCRLDTIFQGAISGARPQCWFNPNGQIHDIGKSDYSK